MQFPSMRFWALALPPLVGCAWLAACSSGLGRADLAAIYDRGAHTHSPQRNPVIVIPGLIGSRLVDDASGKVVWGAFGRGAARPGNPTGARLAALPLAAATPFADLRDGVRTDGVLDNLQIRLLGLPLELKAYFYLLGALGTGGYQEAGLEGAVDYGDDHFTCYQFPYDWRRDNVENARRLEEFIAEKRIEVRAEIRRRWGIDRPEIRFDLVAHSMGAVLARYFLRYGGADLPADGSLPELTWRGAASVERAILVAPPNTGTLDSLIQLVEGRTFGPLLPKYPPAILGSFVSGYQLMPRSRHGLVVWDTPAAEPVEDLFDPELWTRLDWGLADPDQIGVLRWLLPDAADDAERRTIALDYQRRALERGRSFTRAIDHPAEPPEHLELYLVAGDSEPTLSKLAVDPVTGVLRRLATAAGDGTVLRASALGDERQAGSWQPTLVSPISWKASLFLATDHLGVTRDPGFTDNVLYWLLEEPRQQHRETAERSPEVAEPPTGDENV